MYFLQQEFCLNDTLKLNIVWLFSLQILADHKLSVHLRDIQIVHVIKIQYLCSHHIQCTNKNSSIDLEVLGTKLRNTVYKFLTVGFYTISKPLKNSTAGL
jgi:hypothetical protein